jgi:hypothetical protein
LLLRDKKVVGVFVQIFVPSRQSSSHLLFEDLIKSMEILI